MKKICLFVFGLFVCGSAYAAAPAVREQSITSVGTPTTVSVSSYTWTAIPAASSLTGRTGLIVDVPAGNNANMGCIISASASGVTVSTGIMPIELIKGNANIEIPLGDSLYLHCVTTHTDVENIHVQEIRR